MFSIWFMGAVYLKTTSYTLWLCFRILSNIGVGNWVHMYEE
jgi:hypothetical protein